MRLDFNNLSKMNFTSQKKAPVVIASIIAPLAMAAAPQAANTTPFPGVSEVGIINSSPTRIIANETRSLEGTRPLLVDLGHQDINTGINEYIFLHEYQNRLRNDSVSLSVTWQDINNNKSFDPDIDGVALRISDSPQDSYRRETDMVYYNKNYIPLYGEQGEYFRGDRLTRDEDNVVQSRVPIQDSSRTRNFFANIADRYIEKHQGQVFNPDLGVQIEDRR